jgi:chromosome segregation ATPase
VAANYQAYEVELGRLKQALVKQANYILALEEQLKQSDQIARQQQNKLDSQLASYLRLKQQSETLQKDIAALTQQTNVLQEENASLNKTIKDLTKTNHEKHLKIQEQSAHYNKTLTFVNAIKGTVEPLLEQFPEMEAQANKLFASEYKKSVEFRILVDDIKTAPHEDQDFKLLLPQTHSHILRLLEKSAINSR